MRRHSILFKQWQCSTVVFLIVLWSIQILDCCLGFVASPFGHHVRQPEPTRQQSPHATIDDTTSWDTFRDELGLSSTSSISIPQQIVQIGMKFPNRLKPPTTTTKVSGCVANVYIQTIFPESDRIQVLGTADAMLSRGLLALIAYVANRSTTSQILQWDPNTIADAFGIRSALGPGRNDGLANMVRVIQNDIHKNDNNQISKQSAGNSVNLPVKKIKTEKKKKMKPTVALLLSGGVDSSVALNLLLQQGFDVTAFYLRIWLEDELAHLGTCPWEEDYKVCQDVCKQANNGAGVPLHTVSLQEEYHKHVMEHTLHEAMQGRTPNPDILCNSRIKFGCFLDYLHSTKDFDEEFFDYIASGHYAQLKTEVLPDNTIVKRLYRAPDAVKDQSYFLCTLTQQQLSKLIFPIGHLEKSQVRQLANDIFQLPNRNRPDSQGLCFLGKLKFSDFLQANLGRKPGPIIDALTGAYIGQHDGVWYHTVGQRKGIGNSLIPLATSQGPWYVVAKDPKQNIIFASNQYNETKFDQPRSEFQVEEIHWISPDGPPLDVGESSIRLKMKIRHGPKLVGGILMFDVENANKQSNKVGLIRLDEKDGGLAPGQYVVFYTDSSECLGGGIISELHWSKFLNNYNRQTFAP